MSSIRFSRPRYRHGLVIFGVLAALAIADARGHTSNPDGSESASAAYAPLEILPSGHPVAEIRLDGLAPKRFVIDTAASTTTIAPRLRAEMPNLAAKKAATPLNGASGAVDVELAPVRRIETAGLLFENKELLLLPPGPVDNLGVDGILGADLIADYAVEMNLPARKWRMAKQADPSMLAGYAAQLPFTLDAQRAPRLTIKVNGIEVPAVLDTGARGTILNWAAARSIGITPEDPGLLKGSDVKGASSHGTASYKVKLRDIAIGDEILPGREVRIADLSVFDVLGYKKGEPAIILGIDFFADRRILIDHPALRLHISPPISTANTPR